MEQLTPGEALELRGGRRSRVILTGVLATELRRMNRVRARGEELPFGESNIIAALQALDDIPFDGLVRTNEQAYDLMRLGKSFPQLVKGNVASYDLDYVNWNEPSANVFHVTEEFAVDSANTVEARRPDVVLFVNGIPFAVIECKRPDIKGPLREALSHRFVIRRTVTSLASSSRPNSSWHWPAIRQNTQRWERQRSSGRYGERRGDEEVLRDLVNRPLPGDVKARLFADRFRHVRVYFDEFGGRGAGSHRTGPDSSRAVPAGAAASTGPAVHPLRPRGEEGRPMATVLLRQQDHGENRSARPGRKSVRVELSGTPRGAANRSRW